jgi:serine/threonine-protein kinase HipA
MSSLKILYKGILVGFLTEQNGKTFFEYDSSWLKSGFSISPLQLPLKKEIFSFPELSRKKSFLGLPGIFADSLPDKFGNSIIQQYLSGKGITSPTQIQKLAYIGNKGVGALTYEPSESTEEIKDSIEMRRLVDAAKKAISGKLDGSAREIMSIGSSAGGARAKAVISLNKKTNEIRSGNLDAPEGFEHYIIKFDGMTDGDQRGWTKLESAYFKIAKASKMNVPEFDTMTDAEGLTHFLIKRFDRVKNSRVHMHTFGGLLHSCFYDQAEVDYLTLSNALRDCGAPQSDIDELFRRIVFNVCLKNQDDHVKNHSLIYQNNEWRLSPAYDLTYAVSDWCSSHQISISGKISNISKKDLMSLSEKMGINNANKILNEVMEATSDYLDFFLNEGISHDFLQKNQIIQNIDNSLGLIGKVNSGFGDRNDGGIKNSMSQSASFHKCKKCSRPLRGLKRTSFGICSICSPKYE